jgi:tetratricopeptide (TPR) repeat protein/predicted Ser/Thr protein kinase
VARCVFLIQPGNCPAESIPAPRIAYGYGRMPEGCPPDETLHALTRAKLPADEAEAIRVHLSGCESCRERAEFLAPTLTSAVEGPLPELSIPMEFGEQIGRYRVLRELGRGGMGVVYVAHDPELDRKVALKLLRADASGTGEDRLRLLREAQAMARLSHPNVVAVHDVGTYLERVFVAMDLVEGRTLADWLREDHGWREVLAKFREAGKGLAAAHAAGLVHRDFKPDNVLLGDDGRVQVTDFGLARVREAPEAPRPVAPEALSGLGGNRTERLTQLGTIMGTPAYMAPEQVLGENSDERSDVFSFAVSLYEGLYGARPYESMPAVLEGRLQPAPRNAKVPAWVRRAVVKGLSRKPEDRFSSIQALLDALGDDPAVRRQRIAAGVLAVGLLAIAGVLGFRADRQHDPCSAPSEVWSGVARAKVSAAFAAAGVNAPESYFRRTSEAMAAAAERWSGARAQTCLATRERHEQSEEVMRLRLACLDRQRIEMEALVELFAQARGDLVEKSAAAVYALPLPSACTDPGALSSLAAPIDPKLAPQVDALQNQLASARALLDVGKAEQAAQALEPIARRAQELNDAPLEATVRFALGQALHGKGDESGASAAYKRAVYAAEGARADELAARASASLVQTSYNARGNAAESNAWAELTRIILERNGGGVLPEGDLEHALGAMLIGQNEFARALPHAQRAVELRTQAYGAGHPETLRSMNNVAAALGESGQYQESIDILEKVLAGYEKLFGPDASTDEVELINITWDEIFQRRFAQAERSLERASAIDRLHPQGLYTIAVLEAKARFFIDQKRTREGLATLDEARAMMAKLGMKEGPWLQTLDSTTALAHLNEGDFARALAETEALLPRQEKLDGTDSSALVMTLLHQGQALAGLGQPAKAIPALERSLALAVRHQLSEDKTAVIRFALARALTDAHQDPARSHELAEQARAVFASRAFMRPELAELESWNRSPGAEARGRRH